MKFVPAKASRAIARTILEAKKQSPHIFFAGGVAGVAVGTVMACRATLKLENTVDEIRNDVENLKELKEAVDDDRNNYTQEQYAKDFGYVYTKAAIRVGKLYGPSIAVGIVSVAALTGSHIQLTRRNTALTAALAATMKTLEEYRDRVRQEIGEERERELHQGLVIKAHEDEDGRKKLDVDDPNKYSMYACMFDSSNPNWTKDPELNRIFVQCQQNYANHLLQHRGHVFLNDVYDSLGFDRTKAGAVVGWVFNGEGDNYIDFGIFMPSASDFVNGRDDTIILDFNVDGVVWDKL